MSVTALTPERRATLHRRIRLIVAFTIVYNVIEAVVAIAAGSAASSAALIGFGLDSSIEVLSAAAVAWQFTRRDPERWEKPTLRVIAVAFFALAVYVAASSALSLLGGDRPEHSAVGLVLTALSVVIMPLVSFAERRAGVEIGSATAVARLEADADLHLPVGRGAHRTGPQQPVRLVVGGCRRRTRHRDLRRSRGPRGMEGRRLRDLGRHDPGRRARSSHARRRTS